MADDKVPAEEGTSEYLEERSKQANEEANPNTPKPASDADKVPTSDQEIEGSGVTTTESPPTPGRSSY